MASSNQPISWATIFRLLVALLAAYLVVRLWPLLELLLLALLIAITFAPFLRWTKKKNWPHWLGVTLCGLILFGFTLVTFAAIVPAVISQSSEFISKLPAFRNNLIAHLPPLGPIRRLVDQVLSSPHFSNPDPLLKQFLSWGTIVVTGVAEFFLVLIVALYFIADGERVFDWLRAFLPPSQRNKTKAASEEILSVASHYIIGQLITSVLCGLYAFLVLAFWQVPGAVVLAVLAAIFDILPLIGFFLFTIPTVLIALTVSPAAAIGVALLYLLYKFVEDYFIVPKVYGDALRLSSLTVLLSCLIAAAASGVVGVILVLPIVACYPIIERYWLQPYLQRDTVPQHTELDRRAHDE